MKLPSFSVLRRAAIVSGVVIGLAGALMFWQIFGIYDCAGKTFEGMECPELGRAAVIVPVAQIVMVLAGLVLVAAIVAIIIQSSKKSK